MNKTKDILLKINQYSTSLVYGREIVSNWVSKISTQMSNQAEIKILDVGCGAGNDLQNVKEILKGQKVFLYGFDFQQKEANRALEKGIEISLLDIEHDRFPFENGSLDLIIANQIFEHIKEIYWVLSECSRVLKSGGYLIVGVPNLAALHNRLLLLAGKQPACLHVVGPHVRGFTQREFKGFLELGRNFRVMSIKGTNLFPLPQIFSKAILRFFPGLGMSLLFLCRRVKRTTNILQDISGRELDTNYLLGRRY